MTLTVPICSHKGHENISGRCPETKNMMFENINEVLAEKGISPVK